jgi:transcriptional regulator GlxA family with amidase domain
MDIVFALYEGMTALDLIGPYQVFAVAPDMNVTLAASTPGVKTTDSGMQIGAPTALSAVKHADVIIVPGTSEPQLALADRGLIDWLEQTSPKAQWTASVCTGALLLGAAGLLRGKCATTHWLVLDALREYGAEPVRERVVIDGQTVTAAGVSAGIDMALTLLARLTNPTIAQVVQLGIEYDPQPPFNAGSPKTADPQVVALATQVLLEAAPGLRAAQQSKA